MKSCVLACVLIVLLSACGGAQSLRVDDTVVLSIVMKSRCAYAETHWNGEHEFLSSMSRPIADTSFPNGIDGSALKSLLARNKVSSRLPKVELCQAYRLITHDALKDALVRTESSGSDWWGNFHKTFPKTHGIFYLSLPGYSENGRVALVQVSGACGRLCGSGFYWVFHKAGGKWIFEKSIPAWVS